MVLYRPRSFFCCLASPIIKTLLFSGLSHLFCFLARTYCYMGEMQRESGIRVDATVLDISKTEELKLDEESQKKIEKKEEILEENKKKGKLEGMSDCLFPKSRCLVD